ncbi:hypothetical protein [Butyrivibrio sp. VCD2006]|uniref:hypothetical protein n=1 Tax=Butyrivibrio sp. VCD2006 TaxID=1280664 RepID=UPI00040E8F6A|nr:hypothetical protein [Butyrivibrio sp. VCD2006]
MHKVEITEVKRLLAVLLSGAVLLSSGCGGAAGSGVDQQSGNGTYADGQQVGENAQGDDSGNSEQNMQGAGSENESAADDNGSSNTNGSEASDGTGSGENSSTQLSEEELNSPVDFTYQTHPLNMVNGADKYAIANYYSIELDRSSKEKFGKLQKVLDDNATAYDREANEFFTSSAEEIKEMFDSGWGLAYESDKNIFPIRADGRVFSYIVSNYLYLAGAHGFCDFSNYNYDPVTGEEIQFSDVVKDTDALPEIIVSELEKQNEDLAKNFEDLPSDRENLVSGIPDRLKDNAKGLSWAVDYDGIWCCFEDYAMGYYAIGTQMVKILFADYPDVFTDTYDNYKDKEIPDIKEIGKELKEADLVSVDAGALLGGGAASGDSSDGGAYPSGLDDDGREPGEGDLDEGYGEDWWYHAVVKNPGWSAWTADGIDTDAGKPSFELSEVKSTTTDWLNEDVWSAENGIPLPERFPFSDGTYNYSVVNNAEGGELSLTVFNEDTQTLEGNYYFDEFISPPDKGEGLFADFTEPEIQYALVKDNTLYVSLGHRTYAAANPHKSYIVAIDMVSGETLWKSDDQVCGSHNFLIMGDSIYCGYGFTDEPDFIYILNRHNGKVQKKIKVKSAPYYFIECDGYLFVLTYNTEYQYKILE